MIRGREYLKTMVQLATTAFGLVAALAWNDAITALFRDVFGERSTVLSRFGYALVVTLIVVWVTSRLARLADQSDRSASKSVQRRPSARTRH